MFNLWKDLFIAGLSMGAGLSIFVAIWIYALKRVLKEKEDD